MAAKDGSTTITADLVFLPDGKLHPAITLTIDEAGVIIAIEHDASGASQGFSGILVPGFINSHCHLELSNLKGKIQTGRELHGFIQDIVGLRKTTNYPGTLEIENINQGMWNKGIQAVGDICNTSTGFEIKSNSKIKYYNLVEVFGLSSKQVESRIESAKELARQSVSMGISGSIVPHAPYSVCPELFSAITATHDVDSGVWSIHHCESESEKQFVSRGIGNFRTAFDEMKLLGNDFSGFGPTPTEYVSRFFPQHGKILLVHNTYMNREDVRVLKKSGRFDDIYFCLCPNANLYIEGRLSDIPMMISEGCKIVIGTDSLASNHSLSIMDELSTIRSVFPEIAFEEMLQWSTANGAQLFGWNDLGKIEVGKNPGLVCVSGKNVQRIK